MKFKLYEKHKSTFGIDANIVAALVYLLPGFVGILIPQISVFMFLFPILIYFFEKKSDLVRFHALQYILLSLVNTCSMYLLYFLSTVSSSLLVIAYYTSNLITLILFGLLLFSVYKAFCWRSWRIPVIGKFVSQFIQEEIEY